VKELRASIDIDAPPERVWAVLTDLGGFEDWNPFITHAAGGLSEGARLRITIEPPGGRPMSFRPTVREVQPNRKIRWMGRFLVPGIFDGEHTLAIEPLGQGRVRFSQVERFSGALTMFSGKLFDRTQRGFEAMNEAVKRRSESLEP